MWSCAIHESSNGTFFSIYPLAHSLFSSKYLFLSHLSLGLVGNSFLASSEFSLIEQIVVAERGHVLIKFKDKWASSRDVVSENLLLRHASEVLDDGSERVAMSNNNDFLAFLHLWANNIMPVWKHTVECNGQRLSGR